MHLMHPNQMNVTYIYIHISPQIALKCELCHLILFLNPMVVYATDVCCGWESYIHTRVNGVHRTDGHTLHNYVAEKW